MATVHMVHYFARHSGHTSELKVSLADAHGAIKAFREMLEGYEPGGKWVVDPFNPYYPDILHHTRSNHGASATIQRARIDLPITDVRIGDFVRIDGDERAQVRSVTFDSRHRRFTFEVI